MGRRIVVTGASTGFGNAIALEARRRAWDVLATVRKDADAVGLEDAGCTTGRLDLYDSESIASFADYTIDWCGGRLDALVNNAGTTYPAPIEVISMDDLRGQFEVNVFGHVDLTQRLLPSVREVGGTVVFISSDGAVTTAPIIGAYSASKRAIEAIAEALAIETYDQGLRVVVVSPGAYETSIWDTSAERGDEYLGTNDRAQMARYKELGEQVRALAFSQPKHDPAGLASVAMDAIESSRPRFIYRAPLQSRVITKVRRIVPDRTFHRATRLLLRRAGSR